MKIMNINQEITAIIFSAALIVFLAIVFRVFTMYKAAKKDTKKTGQVIMDYMIEEGMNSSNPILKVNGIVNFPNRNHADPPAAGRFSIL